MEKTKKQESEKPEIPVLKKGQTIRFDDGPGEKIAEINGTDICKNIVLMINELNPENPLELGKIIKSYKPHIKYTTLDTYVRGYLKYLKLNWPLPSKAFKKIDWAMKNEAPLSDQEPREKTKAKSTKETGQKKEKPIEETLAKKKEWEDEIITDSEAAQIVVTYDGKVTKRRLGMLLNTILLNGNNVPRKELPDLMVLNVTDVVRHARYAQKKKLISLRKGNYRLTDGGKYMCIHIRDKYNLDVPPPEVEGRTVQKQEKKTGKKYKRKAGMHRLGNKLALKIVKKYETALYRERYEDAVYIVFTEGPIKEADIIEKLSEMEGRSLSRNTVYAHLRYACERRDMKIADGLYRALPNAKRVVKKIQIKKAKAEKPSPPQSTETVEERARRETKESYGIDIDDEKYQKLKNTLDSAFGYKKSIKEFGNTKSWTNWEAGAYLRYGVKIGEIIPVGKAEKPDGTTRYALKKNEEKLPRERKEIHIKSKGTIRDKNNKEEGARESKNYSIFQKKSEK